MGAHWARARSRQEVGTVPLMCALEPRGEKQFYWLAK
jgi:hypothetical protein